MVTLHTNHGDIVIKTFAGKVPLTVENFLNYCRSRFNDLHSATAQFFINVVDDDFLNFRSKCPNSWGYCVFAEVTDGLDMVDKIKGVATSRSEMHTRMYRKTTSSLPM